MRINMHLSDGKVLKLARTNLVLVLTFMQMNK